MGNESFSKQKTCLIQIIYLYLQQQNPTRFP